ncbi:hypothetical protein BKA80DRAFT_265791 [Phyllosticta citrichinensis]
MADNTTRLSWLPFSHYRFYLSTHPLSLSLASGQLTPAASPPCRSPRIPNLLHTCAMYSLCLH